MRQIKADLASKPLVPESWEHENGQLHVGVQADEEEVGIRGLTIVLHLKGKDDLVINTDLTHDAEKGS